MRLSSELPVHSQRLPKEAQGTACSMVPTAFQHKIEHVTSLLPTPAVLLPRWTSSLSLQRTLLPTAHAIGEAAGPRSSPPTLCFLGLGWSRVSLFQGRQHGSQEAPASSHQPGPGTALFPAIPSAGETLSKQELCTQCLLCARPPPSRHRWPHSHLRHSGPHVPQEQPDWGRLPHRQASPTETSPQAPQRHGRWNMAQGSHFHTLQVLESSPAKSPHQVFSALKCFPSTSAIRIQ